MIDMIRVGRTRNLLRASSSPSEIWPRSAHHHLGQRHLTGRTKRPDKSPHSITMPKPQKFLANESGIHKRRFDPSSLRTPSADGVRPRGEGRASEIFSQHILKMVLSNVRSATRRLSLAGLRCRMRRSLSVSRTRTGGSRTRPYWRTPSSSGRMSPPPRPSCGRSRPRPFRRRPASKRRRSALR